ncbi:hypothetical protein ACIQ57_23865 [Lysinibacillus xylanilyticus]|uniref:hypothetical protein n=1 Tax=Lysinibacillus xylanilyticus TaxID=582475 RepID=UPI00381703B8
MSIDEIESVIVGASAVATSVFSFLIWRANIQSAKAAKGAADAAEASAKISKLMLDAEEEKKQNLRDQIKRDILKQTSFIMNILNEMKESSMPSLTMIRLPEKINNVTNFELASYFTKEERQLIYYTVKKYESYRNDYFKDGKPNFKMDEKFTKDTEELLEKTKDVIIEFTDKIYVTSNIEIG